MHQIAAISDMARDTLRVRLAPAAEIPQRIARLKFGALHGQSVAQPEILGARRGFILPMLCSNSGAENRRVLRCLHNRASFGELLEIPAQKQHAACADNLPLAA